MNSQKVDEYSAYLKEDNNIDTIIDNNDANANYMASDNGTNGEHSKIDDDENVKHKSACFEVD
ncbi:4109_t:CDS:2 [Entrophospora sp. SA101]|nr:4109_t:CDS:2 [Entrophospora sp. SA101]